MGIRVKAPATEKPITTAEAREQIGLINTDMSLDGKLLRAVDSAIDYVESESGRVLCAKTLELFLSKFPSGAIRIPVSPISAISSIKYYDTNNQQQTIDPVTYYFDPSALCVEIISTAAWPSVFARPDAVVVEFVAGFASAANVPPILREACLAMVGHFFENREGQTPPNIDQLIGRVSLRDY